MAAIMAASVAAPAAARDPIQRGNISDAGLTPIRVLEGNKSPSGRLAQSDPELLSRRDGQLVNIMIKFDVDAVASYRGGLNGMAATSPAVTGKTLKENGGAVGSYRRFLDTRVRGIRTRLGQVQGLQLGRSFLTAFGGAVARVPANRAKDLLKIDGVAAVMYDYVAQPLTDASPDFIGATPVYPSLGGNAKAGKGVKVGIIDTGIWPEHPSFTDPGIPHPGGTYSCDFGDSGDANDDPFTCNDKLIGAYAFLETQLTFSGTTAEAYCNTADNTNVDGDSCSARDADGHGTHTSSTAAGRRLTSAVHFGVERGPLSGIAPGAHVIHYRVCIAGCYSSDSVDAVEQAIDDDVDVINFSISGGSNPYSDSVELAFLDAYAAGILVNASAGNDGPGAATANHGGPWVNTVGASTSDRHFVTTLHMTADGGATLDMEGVTVTAGIGSPTPVVLGKDTESGELCTTEATPGEYTGEIVACQRGSIARVEKGYNVLQGGADGMILYNVSVTDLETDNHYLPTVHVNDQAETIEAFVSTHTGVMAWWDTGAATEVQGDVMASFSSRGPLGDFIKPDVTAPGIQILAGASPEHLDDPAEGLGPDGQLFQAIAGTSMSSPHAAGASALLKAAHPSWTPGQIKSALMTSSLQDVLKEDGATAADPFDRGAGSIRVNRAVNPTVTFEATSAQFFAAGDDPFARIDLNIASINAPEFPGVINTRRTARNVTSVTQTLNITTWSPSGAKITVSPSKLVLAPFQSKPFDIRIEGAALADGQYFGHITLNPKTDGYINAVLPVAFNKNPGDVTLEHDCDSPIAKGTEADCEVTVTNYAGEDAHVSVRVKGENANALKINDWSAGNRAGNGFVWNGTLGPSLPPEVVDITSPGDGFIDISFLTGQGSYGDETMGIYDVSAYGGGVQWGDVTYDAISVTSNGYLIMGEGSAADVDFVPQDMPDPARPNAVLAPYWTDLDLGDGGDVHIGLLDDGTDVEFMIIQWTDAPIWGSCPGACENRTFQIWIATEYGANKYNGGMSYITFEYPGAMGPGAGNDNGVIEDDGLIVGAEDAVGQTAATLGVDNEPGALGYYIDIGPSQAGGSMTISYDAKGKKLGTWPVRATMTSDVTQGTAKDVENIQVVP